MQACTSIGQLKSHMQMTPSCWHGPEIQPGPACPRSPSQSARGRNLDYLLIAGESTGDAVRGIPSRHAISSSSLDFPMSGSEACLRSNRFTTSPFKVTERRPAHPTVKSQLPRALSSFRRARIPQPTVPKWFFITKHALCAVCCRGDPRVSAI